MGEIEFEDPPEKTEHPLDSCGYVDLSAEFGEPDPLALLRAGRERTRNQCLEAGRAIMRLAEVKLTEQDEVWGWSLEGGGPPVTYSNPPTTRRRLYWLAMAVCKSLESKKGYAFEREYRAHRFAHQVMHALGVKVPQLEVKRGKWWVCERIKRSLRKGTRKSQVSGEITTWCRVEWRFLKENKRMMPFPRKLAKAKKGTS